MGLEEIRNRPCAHCGGCVGINNVTQNGKTYHYSAIACRDFLLPQVNALTDALYALLRFATKPQPRDEEEQEQVVAKVAKALKGAEPRICAYGVEGSGSICKLVPGHDGPHSWR